ncbi:hypothetical protein DC345_19785 [Paenibacillus taichungensis]|uniref:Copper amine oxidase-like N-terminal domain-containing protein n=1 Tax=Paenibacillus taichungensis TaxID=484184 RepID=A0A329QMJ5_9BACL|nr:stalk domain-containing protein [Paenibacillus taichungensis]RAW13585.1 hypothetical protein DC345_19785 [Paenibacillus taichungensis]
MKFKKTGLLLLAFLMVGGTGAYAASKSKTVQATISNFKYVLNGSNWTPQSKTEPVVINGQTYIPVSLAKEATKTNITVDAKSGKMSFGEKLAKTPFDKERIYYFSTYAGLSRDSKYTENKYKEVVTIKNLGHIVLYPNSKYQTLVLDLKLADGSGQILLKDEDTGEHIKSLFLEEGKQESVEINVTSISNKGVRLYMEADDFSKGTVLVVQPTSHYK